MSSLRTTAERQADFFEACWLGELDRVNALLAEGTDLKAMVDASGRTPLHEASLSGHLSTVEALIAKGADPKAADRWGDTPLHSASRRGHLPVVLALLGAGADPNAVNKHGNTPLHWASIIGSVQVVLALLAAGADPRKGTPLIEFPKGSSDFVLTRYARDMVRMSPELEKVLLSFQIGLDVKNPRGAWAIAVVRGIFFKHGASSEGRAEVIPEGPAVPGAGGPGGA